MLDEFGKTKIHLKRFTNCDKKDINMNIGVWKHVKCVSVKFRKKKPAKRKD